MILAKKEKTLPDTNSGPLFPLDAFRASQRKRRDGKVAMKMLYTLRNYILYCGIEKDAYNPVKKDAYVSNFMVWRILHGLMTFVFALLFVGSLSVDIMAKNKLFYLAMLVYSIVVTCLFLFVLKKDSLVAQLIIYLSISMLFLFGAMITQNRPDAPATTFIVMLLITPMFMIDKPYFIAIELGVASAIFLVWMHGVKPYDIWKMDAANVISYAFVGIFLHVIANSIRIKEFVLTREIRIQKDTDELTGLMNKSAVTREINNFLADKSRNKGLMFLLDIDRFKSINDTYGHDVGDSVIRQFGALLRDAFTHGEIIGRFGGDEFILFIKDTDNARIAEEAAHRIIDGAAERIKLPNGERSVSVSVGIAAYHGAETNYSEIFKKADIAMYRAKADRTTQLSFYLEDMGDGPLE